VIRRLNKSADTLGNPPCRLNTHKATTADALRIGASERLPAIQPIGLTIFALFGFHLVGISNICVVLLAIIDDPR
jgi:hypothetical protein